MPLVSVLLPTVWCLLWGCNLLISIDVNQAVRGFFKNVPSLSECGNHKGRLGDMEQECRGWCEGFDYVVKEHDENKAAEATLSRWCAINIKWLDWLWFAFQRVKEARLNTEQRTRHQTTNRRVPRSSSCWRRRRRCSRMQHLLHARRSVTAGPSPTGVMPAGCSDLFISHVHTHTP